MPGPSWFNLINCLNWKILDLTKALLLSSMACLSVIIYRNNNLLRLRKIEYKTRRFLNTASYKHRPICPASASTVLHRLLSLMYTSQLQFIHKVYLEIQTIFRIVRIKFVVFFFCFLFVCSSVVMRNLFHI